MRMFCLEGGTKSFSNEFIDLITEEKLKEVLTIIKSHPSEDLVDGNGNHLLHLLAKLNDIRLIQFFIKSKYKLDIEDASGLTPMMTAALHKRFGAAHVLYSAHVEALVEQSAEKTIHPIRENSRANWDNARSELTQRIKHAHLHDVVSKFRTKGLNSKQIGEILAKIFCNLDDVVRLHDLVMTEAFLQSEPVFCYFESGLREVVARFNWRHMEVLMNYQPTSEHSFITHFIRLMMDNISDYHQSEDGRVFLKRAFTWEIFNEDSLAIFEKFLKFASTENVALFLQYSSHLIAEVKCERAVVAAIINSPNLEFALLLENYEIDVDKRYHRKENTALHIAANLNSAKNIRWLLEKGADPNALNGEYDTPLRIAFQSNIPDEECVKQLLLGDADVTMIECHLKNGLFGGGFYMQYNTNVIKVLAAHFAIIEALDESIIGELIEAYLVTASESLRSFLRKCREQVNEMKNHTIRDMGKYRQTAFTLFTLLAEIPENIAHFVNEGDLEVMDELLECKRETWPSYYCEALRKRAKDIVKIQHLRIRAALVTCQLTGIEDPQHLVVQKIVRYFSMRDLLKLQ